MKILILSKQNFDKMMQYNVIDDYNVESQDIMFISICSPQDDDQPYISELSKKSHFKEEHPNVKIMYFGDYSGDQVLNNPHVFTRGHAKELYKFIKENENKGMAIIHCGGGISRSGAIGTFIFDLYGDMTFEEFKRKNPQIQPNSHILRLLREEYKKHTRMK
jgi:predicted protein tyrosine phosphatase